MRETIKFRAWDSKNNCFLNHAFVVNQTGSVFFEYNGGGQTQNYIHLMQYTGLKDKNGKEIYEGDIVKHTFQQMVPVNGSFNAPVFFHEGVFTIGIVNNKPLTLREAIKISNEADGLEIIGNIYENPELLESKTIV